MSTAETNDPRLNATPENPNNCPNNQNCEDKKSSCARLPECRQNVLSLISIHTTTDLFGGMERQLETLVREVRSSK